MHFDYAPDYNIRQASRHLRYVKLVISYSQAAWDGIFGPVSAGRTDAAADYCYPAAFNPAGRRTCAGTAAANEDFA